MFVHCNKCRLETRQRHPFYRHPPHRTARSATRTSREKFLVSLGVFSLSLFFFLFVGRAHGGKPKIHILVAFECIVRVWSTKVNTRRLHLIAFSFGLLNWVHAGSIYWRLCRLGTSARPQCDRGGLAQHRRNRFHFSMLRSSRSMFAVPTALFLIC